MPSPKPLTWYPKPPRNRGFCMHMSPGNMMPIGRPEDVDNWLNHSQEMGADWAKLVVDGPNAVDLVRHVKARGFEPIIRIYLAEQWPDAMVDRIPQLGDWVRAYVDAGASYFEIGNEPNLKTEWKGGEGNTAEWDIGAQPNRVADAWYRDARVIIAAGGLPGVPALSPGGHYNDVDWTRTFFQYVKQRGWEDVLCQGSWIAIHNGTLNHPLDYPADDVNQHGIQLTQAEYDQFPEWAGDLNYVNEQRRNGKNPGQTLLSVDANGKDTGGSNCFNKFIAYHDIFVGVFGYEIPILATEGGVWVGTTINADWPRRIWDPRYPATTMQQQSEWMVAIAQKMMSGGFPDYYFCWCEWCLANMDMENSHRGFENDALFSVRAWGDIGGHLPVVDAMKAMPKRERPPYVDPEPPEPPVGKQLSFDEVAALTELHGFVKTSWEDERVTMTALVDAESSRWTDAVGVNRDDAGNVLSEDLGLAQINSGWIPELISKGIISQRDDLFDPNMNLAAASYVYSIQGWRAWTTYGGSRYQAALTPAAEAVARLDASKCPTHDELWKFAIEQCVGVPENAALITEAKKRGLVPICSEGRGMIKCGPYVGQLFVPLDKMILLYMPDVAPWPASAIQSQTFEMRET